jgi:hypothetical protein
VNYGTVDEGMGSDYMSTEEPSVAENANKTKPDKVTPAPPTEEKAQTDNSDKNVVTQNTEDAPEVTANSKTPSPTVATQPTTKTVPSQPLIKTRFIRAKPIVAQAREMAQDLPRATRVKPQVQP